VNFTSKNKPITTIKSIKNDKKIKIIKNLFKLLKHIYKVCLCVFTNDIINLIYLLFYLLINN